MVDGVGVVLQCWQVNPTEVSTHSVHGGVQVVVLGHTTVVVEGAVYSLMLQKTLSSTQLGKFWLMEKMGW